MPCEHRVVHPTDQLKRISDPGVATVAVCRIHGSELDFQSDELAVEEPLEIRLSYDRDGTRVENSVSITMRTPSHDAELAVGFLFTEGMITAPEQFAGIREDGQQNAVCVELQPGVAVDLGRLERHFYTSSSCGVCGKVALDAVRVTCPVRIVPDQPVVESSVINGLPETLRAAQAVFERTGGLHASALFNTRGTLLEVREDVGRHNALDKLIGARFLAGQTPLSQNLLLLSGRVSFELVQKAAVAGIPIVAAVGAPSTLAVDLAREYGMTVVGFVRQDRYNIYAGAGRIRHATPIPNLDDLAH
jgi:FdhD protein